MPRKIHTDQMSARARKRLGRRKESRRDKLAYRVARLTTFSQ